MNTYISLFSGAGVGCYGFKSEGFECIATNELIERRIQIQRANKKCKYESGYICNDLSKEQTKQLLYHEIEFWKKQEKLKRVDVVIATPPCQGMSVANHKKNEADARRNSLVVESIQIIKEIKPRFFVFENVPAFMKTVCTDLNGQEKTIADAIQDNLGDQYSYTSKVINFKNYGACSSRSRTVVIGVANDYADEVSPFELYPPLQREKTLRQVIGDLMPLTEFGQIDPHDIYHAFRTYPEYMREWIHNLKEGDSAFDNEDDCKKPHRVVAGKVIINQRKNGDKYRRQYWDKVGPCVHTRNDLLASQNTVHPQDDRVFSIRELMRMMTVPDDFRWTDADLNELNGLSPSEKKAFLKKEEIKIRQSLGEAVPTVIFQAIAKRMKHALAFSPASLTTIKKIAENSTFQDVNELIAFVRNNPQNRSLSTLRKVAEMANSRRTDHAAYYTNKSLITEMIKQLPDFEQDEIRILEPSVGVGNFIPLLLKRYEGKRLIIDMVDIDEDSLKIAKTFHEKLEAVEGCTFRYIHDDFLRHSFDYRYDLIIGNPPFLKLKHTDPLLKMYLSEAINKNTSNICSFFLDKSLRLADHVSLVFPKFVLNTPEFAVSREVLSGMGVSCILDFGEKGFPGVLIETVALFINTKSKGKTTRVISATNGLKLSQKQDYIFDQRFPYWIIYRNAFFDQVCKKLDFDMFTVFRDRQITNGNTSLVRRNDSIRVLKSRNISDDGGRIDDIDGYDTYISQSMAASLSVYAFLDRDDVYLTPNMTYKPRMTKKTKGSLVNGSVAILIPKGHVAVSEEQRRYFSSEEYRMFYQIARNYQTRSLNVDACSVFFYGLLRKEAKPFPVVAQEESMRLFERSISL